LRNGKLIFVLWAIFAAGECLVLNLCHLTEFATAHLGSGTVVLPLDFKRVGNAVNPLHFAERIAFTHELVVAINIALREAFAFDRLGFAVGVVFLPLGCGVFSRFVITAGTG